MAGMIIKTSSTSHGLYLSGMMGSLEIKLDPACHVDLAIGLLKEVGMDATEELLNLCHELTQGFPPKPHRPFFTPEEWNFIGWCEHTYNTVRAKGETELAYYNRLADEYAPKRKN